MADDDVIINFSSPVAKFVMGLIGLFLAVIVSLAGIIYNDVRNDISSNVRDIRELGEEGEPESLKTLREQVKALKGNLRNFEERYAAERCKDLGGFVDYNTGFCKTEDGRESFRVLDGSDR